MVFFEIFVLVGESVLKESTRRGNGEIIFREFEFIVSGSFGLLDL